MTHPVTSIEPFDHANASEPEYRALFAFTTRLRAEMMPDDPPTPFEEAVAAWRGIPSEMNMAFWVARSGIDILARGHVSYSRAGDHAHLVRGSIQVLPEQRRRGLARRLLARIAERMHEQNRTLMITDTIGRVPAGAAFMERLGATRGLETHVHQLVVGALDRDLIRSWQARASESAAEFEIGRWDGSYPEADLGAIAELHEVMNTQPLGNLAVGPSRVTPERLRLIESALAPRGIQRWTMYVRQRSTGRFAGFTETFWKPSSPEVLQQGDTGVFPEHRGRGLGRWLKAAMLDHVLAEHPEVRFVRTGNADSNAAMLAINRALGFTPYDSRTVWQAEIGAIDAYLSARAALGRE